MLVLIIAKQISNGLTVDANMLSSITSPLGSDNNTNNIQKVRNPATYYYNKVEGTSVIQKYTNVNIHAKIFLDNIIREWVNVPSTYTFFIPNQRILTDWDMGFLDKIDKVLCRTMYVYNMMPVDKRVYIKMTSSCNNNTAAKDYNMCIHLGGKSYTKGTRSLLETWVANNGFLDVNPNIHLIVASNLIDSEFMVENNSFNVDKYWKSLNPVTKTINFGRELNCEQYGNIYMVRHLNNKDFNYFTKKAGISIQPSITEGFGHSINEGRCNKSVVVTTDFPPMNELITDTRCLIAVKNTELVYDATHRDFTVPSQYLYKGDTKLAYIDQKDLASKMRVLLSMNPKQLAQIANKNHKSFISDTKHFKNAMKKILEYAHTNPLTTSSSRHKTINKTHYSSGNIRIKGNPHLKNIQRTVPKTTSTLKKLRDRVNLKDYASPLHEKYPNLNINQPNLKRVVTIISSDSKLLTAVENLRNDFTVIYENTLPAYNAPSFITITDIDLKLDLPSSYVIFYNKWTGRNPSIYKYLSIADDGKHNVSDISFTEIYNISEVVQLCINLTTYLVDISQNIELYNVGEHHFTKQQPTKNTPNYDDSYDLWVYADDTLIKKDAKNGVPYEKYLTACISAFIPPISTVLDVGTNIGTVALPLSRLHNSNINVVSFEAFKNTYSVFIRNIIQNKAFNITPLFAAAGDTRRKDISLSDEVVVEDYVIKSNEVLNINDDNVAFHYGAVHIGTGSNLTNVVRIDDLKLNISAMKVDVEGAEPLVFYGARETIRRCMPVIVFEKNNNVVSQDMINVLGLSEEVAGFNIINYCRSLGYKKIYELHIDDYMLVPPGRNQLITNSIAKFKPFNRFKRFTNAELTGYQMFKLILPKW